MQCKQPFFLQNADTFIRCGRCLACKISFRNEWASRIQCEEFSHYAQTGLRPVFATFTYSEETVPRTGSGERTLCKKDLQTFLSNARRDFGPFRFYACGEYGTQATKRPHYHLVLFPFKANQEREIASRWMARYGRAQCLPYKPQACQYVSKYATKFATAPGRLEPGQEPEFRISSRSPALGVDFAMSVFQRLGKAQRDHWLDVIGDVPKSYRVAGKIYPFGRFLVSKMREAYGIPSNYSDRVKRCPSHEEHAYHHEEQYINLEDYEQWEQNYAQTQKQIKNRSATSKL